MKKILFLFLFLLMMQSITFCQFKIIGGTNLTTTGNVQIVLSDIDLYNGGTLDGTGSTFQFTGIVNSSITDNGNAITFNNITVDKAPGKLINLLGDIYVQGKVTFLSGNIDLNDKYIFLGNTGSFVGESETSRATSSKYGLINATASLNAPNAVNIANLGALVTSTANMGMVSITRTHNAVDVAGGGKSINRVYEFNPTNNAGINATLTLKYFDAELNGLDENNLTQFHSTDFKTYNQQNFSTRDIGANYVTQTGYKSLYKFTLGNPLVILPVKLISFTAECKGNFIQLNWKTSSEQNSDRFDVQRSINGVAWQKIGSVKAKGNSNTVVSYKYDDHSLNSKSAFYRLAQYDLNNKFTYSSIIRGACNGGCSLKVIPNPVVDFATVIIGETENNQGTLALYNATGQKVLQQEVTLKGGTQYKINMTSFAKGIYTLVFIQNGYDSKNIKIIKQ